MYSKDIIILYDITIIYLFYIFNTVITKGNSTKIGSVRTEFTKQCMHVVVVQVVKGREISYLLVQTYY